MFTKATDQPSRRLTPIRESERAQAGDGAIVYRFKKEGEPIPI